MNHDSQAAARPPRSALVKTSHPLISVAEIRGLIAGFGDLFRFVCRHKVRAIAYALLSPVLVGGLMAGSSWLDWYLDSTVDRSSIVLVEVETAPVDWTQPWKRVDSFFVNGTGSIIDGHRILTAAHVVGDAVAIDVTRADSDESFRARLLAVSHELDLAILTVDVDRFFEGAKPLQLQDLESEDDKLIAYGFPGGDLEYSVGSYWTAYRGTYQNTGDSNLRYALDTPIKPGYSGGPLTWNGRLAGVMIEGYSDGEIGCAVPLPVVRHFLEDYEDGHVDGSSAIIGAWQAMENPQIRDYYRLEEGQTGVLVRSVLKAGDGRSHLRSGDIITAIDGYDVDNDGMVVKEPDLRVSFEYLIDRKQVGDTVAVQVLRDRRPSTVYVPLVGAGKHRMRLARYLYDQMPSYLVAGGFVFCALTDNYVQDLDLESVEFRVWAHQAAVGETFVTPDETRDEAVVLVRLLPDATTKGYSDCFSHVVTHVNGRPIGNVQDLAAALEDNSRGYHHILLQPDDKEIIISKAVLGERQQAILDKYEIPADRSDDLAVSTAGR